MDHCPLPTRTIYRWKILLFRDFPEYEYGNLVTNSSPHVPSLIIWWLPLACSHPTTISLRFSTYLSLERVVNMPPRGPARGRTQPPHDPLNPATGRGTPTRGRSVARGGRGDGMRTAEGSHAGGAQDTRGSDDPQPARGRGMGRGLSHGRGEGSTSPAGTGSVRGRSQRGAFRARGEPSTRSRSLGSWPLRRGHRAEEEGEEEPIAIGDLPVYRQPEGIKKACWM